MALARLTKQCRECPFVETCEHKEMEALGDMNGSLFEVDTAMVDNTFMNALIQMAATVGEKLSVPLYCGEYGVIDQAPIVDTLRWYQDFHAVLTKYKIGRAAWTYKEKDFGIIGPHYASIQDQLIKCL